MAQLLINSAHANNYIEVWFIIFSPHSSDVTIRVFRSKVVHASSVPSAVQGGDQQTDAEITFIMAILSHFCLLL